MHHCVRLIAGHCPTNSPIDQHFPAGDCGARCEAGFDTRSGHLAFECPNRYRTRYRRRSSLRMANFASVNVCTGFYAAGISMPFRDLCYLNYSMITKRSEIL